MNGLFPNAWHVARREYLTRVRGRTFVITTALLMLAAAAVVLLPTILDAIGVDDPAAIAVSVEADDLDTDTAIAKLDATFAAGAAAEDGPPATVTMTDDAAAAADDVRGGDLDGLLTIRRDAEDLSFEYLSDEGPGSPTRQLVTQAARSITTQDRLGRAGLTPQEQAEISAPVAFEAIAADPDARDEEDFGPSVLLAYALVIMTFMAILTYGNWVAQSVAEEKSNRVMELLITAATPRQLLAGKVLGTGAAGLTQYALVVTTAAVAFVGSGPLAASLGGVAGDAPSLPSITIPMVLAFVCLFFGGFLLYSTLYAATGSMVSRVEEVQQAAGPLLVLAMGGYIASLGGLNDPDAGWVAALSQVPFFAPYLMPARILLTSVSAVEVLISLAILAVTILLAIWIASRIYSAGVLLYGQRPGWRQVLRATRVAR
jgi:ABC-2 type transport system permease protein